MNRPESLNSFTAEMCHEFLAAIDEIEGDPESRVLVLTGAGRGFCSGANVGVLSHGSAESGIIGSPLVRRIRAMEIPTVAMVNGVAAGGGTALALSCDMRVGCPESRFINAFQRIGLGSGWGGPWLYPRAMGVGKALEILLTGDALDADEAYRVGVLNRLVPADDLEGETMALAGRLAAAAPLAVRETKRQVYDGLLTDLETATDRSDAGEAATIPTEDHQEGIRAFLEKRQPEFKGR